MEDGNKKNSNVSSTKTSDVTDNIVPINQPKVEGKEYENPILSPDDLDSRWLRWKCLKCGFVYEGKEPLSICPKCGNVDPDMFDDAF